MCSIHVTNVNEMEETPDHVERSIFNQLRLDGKLCDVVIEVNGVEFNAHRTILCGCSTYFRALFTNGWPTVDQRLYSAPDVSADVTQLIIEYAYACSVAVKAEHVEALLVAADRFSILGLVDAMQGLSTAPRDRRRMRGLLPAHPKKAL